MRIRVLDTHTAQFVQIHPEETHYAILSHTWDHEKGEQTFEELRTIQRRYTPEGEISLRRDAHPQSNPLPTAVPRDEHSNTGPPCPALPASMDPSPSSLSSVIASISLLNEKVDRLADRISSIERHVSPNTPLAVGESSSSLSQSLIFHPPETVTSQTNLHETPISSGQRSSPSDSSVDSRGQTSLPPIWNDAKLSPKIRMSCQVARDAAYRYIWIDSCCIDKTSSSELSQAINSMYAW